ncbi:protein of unknown function DUF336 [Zymomonas mobilis subsp. pomaceae ATCC 29192]|uniref:UPF0303 protein Zymop_0005 n=1 Tax=Zymomonas mobilis subsp. pomaceae (strain ATCC 29192 / DSM 22645 / JCM 10191 / CCUG 17912 / NBRC 13757 / NCIMB 11200 / NRRL B-4491 / Barker I) TaxID=579138 RepID=F8ESU3_ZYMMT|nr:heme-degrading domain-containing protein [Zymomonas mobilis]AEI36909.1 protein of unknown function DUF336 [Zymomonas mobilis subsp. pomaceae ATCC 29192]
MSHDIDRDIAAVKQQEALLHLPEFNEEIAWQLGSYIRAIAGKEKLPIAIAVARFNQPLFYAAMPNSSPDNRNWIRRKVATVAHYFSSSYAIGLKLKKKGEKSLACYGLDDSQYAFHGGAFPIFVKNAGIVGYIAVSGLDQRDDHALVVMTLAQHLGIDPKTVSLDTLITA